MITSQQIAEHINETKPDLKEFWFEANQDPNGTFNNILIEPFSRLNAFKLELLFSYIVTHPRIYTYKLLFEQYETYMSNAGYSTGMTGLASYMTRKHHVAPVTNTKLIAPHVVNLSKYLNSYLKTKYRSAGASTSTAINLNLEDNLMSFAIFQQWLTTKSSINSVQAINFLQKVKNFDSTRVQFVESILGACPKPSLELQGLFFDSYSSGLASALNGTKYCVINKSRIRENVDRLGITSSKLLDYSDSFYKPFITNLYRTPTPNNNEVSALIAMAAELSVNAKDIPSAKSITEHLKDPAYAELLPAHITAIQASIDKFNYVLKEFTNG